MAYQQPLSSSISRVSISPGVIVEPLELPPPLFLSSAGISLMKGLLFGGGDSQITVDGVVLEEMCGLWEGPLLDGQDMRVYVVEIGNSHPAAIFLAVDDASLVERIRMAVEALLIAGFAY